jgi:iron complex outermembrane recepter protein
MIKKSLFFIFLFAFAALSALAQTTPNTGQISGVVKDPDQAVLAGAHVILRNSVSGARMEADTDGQGAYSFSALPPGSYVVEADANGFKPGVSGQLSVGAGQTVASDLVLALAGNVESVNVSGTGENAYRVDNVLPGGPLGNTPILDLPYSINVISRQLIDDTQSRNFKEAAKYLPLVSFQEMQGPEILRPESRGMQGSNMQNDLKDGMGFAVTTPSALEEYEQIEVVTGLGGPLYGPANPSGMFNFVTKRPTYDQFREIELDYEGSSVGTAHADLGGRFGRNKMFGYRTNLVMADGDGYVSGSQLRRQLAAVALDAHPSAHTVIEGNFSYYNLYQHGYPGWFSYTPSLTAAKNILLPVNAPDPTVRGYGQSFAGVDLNNQIGEVRLKQDFSRNWQLMVGVLRQIATRNINTAVNSFTDNKGDYQSYLANAFSPLAPRFQVKSDLAYLTGKFKTWGLGHEVVIGSTGYRFASYSPVKTPAKKALCPAGDGTTCAPSISDPLVDVPPASGLPTYAGNDPLTGGIYVSNIIHQQGINLGDTITITPKWLLRAAASQDWTWTNNYSGRDVSKAGNYVYQGVSPSGSILYKPRVNMTVYGTFADSVQAPDIAGASTSLVNSSGVCTSTSTSTTCIVNASLALPPYRSIEGEIGYKLALRKVNFSADMFRIQRPFANYVTGVSNPICGALSGTSSCEQFEITGTQVNYGVETMLSGRIFPSLMVTGGLVVLNPKLTDTGIAATNNRDFVGIPAYKSNILAEYRLPVLTGAYFNFDWQHVGRRPVDDVNSTYTPQYNTFDLGLRYTAKVMGNWTTWRVAVENVSDVHYWSTLGPGSITGTSNGSYLGHLGEPRLVTASMRYDF